MVVHLLVNMWIKVGFTSSLSGQGRYQQLFGWAGEAIHEDLLSNVYNNNLRIFYDESMNRLWISFLADDTSGTRRYSQNFWWFSIRTVDHLIYQQSQV